MSKNQCVYSEKIISHDYFDLISQKMVNLLSLNSLNIIIGNVKKMVLCIIGIWVGLISDV